MRDNKEFAFKNYFKYEWKSIILIGFLLIGFSAVLVYQVYMVPTSAYYGAPLITFGFIVLLIISYLFGLVYSFRQYRQTYLKIRNEIEKEKKLYQNFTLDILVNMLYENDIINLELIKCPEGTETEEKQFLKDYIIKLREDNHV